MQLVIDGVPFLLKTPQAFSWLSVYGRVFRVLDRLTSGNLCFCVDGPYGRLFVKYAGAETINYPGRVRDAVRTLKDAMPLYLPQRPCLTRLLAHGEAGEGYAAVFRYEEGVCLHGIPANPAILERLRHEPLIVRLRMLDGLYGLQLELAQEGLLAVDFGDDNILVDFETGSATLCDIDLYRPGGVMINERGRMPGLPRYLAPEEYRKGAQLDGATAVYRLGTLAFDFFGDGRDKTSNAWIGPRNLYQVAARAVSEDKQRRYGTVERFLRAWRDAVGKSRAW